MSNQKINNINDLFVAVQHSGDYVLAPGMYDMGQFTINGEQQAVLPFFSPNSTFTGSGQGETIILVGSQYDTGNEPGQGDTQDGIKVSASNVTIQDLTIRNASRASTPNTIFCTTSEHSPSSLTLRNIEFDCGNQHLFYLFGGSNHTVDGCTFTSDTSSVYCSSTDNLMFTNNRLLGWRQGRAQFLGVAGGLIQGNTFVWDNVGHMSGEAGGMELSFSQNLRVWNNRILTTSPEDDPDNDGEAILAQDATTGTYQNQGSVTALSSDGKTLSTTMTWDGNDVWRSDTDRFKAVGILTGAAKGQWQLAAQGGSSGEIVVPASWVTPPAVGDLVAVFSSAATGLDIRGNVVSGFKNGITLYDGALGCAIVGNVVSEAGGINLHQKTAKKGIPNISVPRSPNSGDDHFPMWDIVVQGNTVLHQTRDYAACVSLLSEDLGVTGHPTPFFGVAVEGNAILGQDAFVSGAESQYADGVLLDWRSYDFDTNLAANVDPSRLGGVAVEGNALTGASVYFGQAKVVPTDGGEVVFADVEPGQAPSYTAPSALSSVQLAGGVGAVTVRNPARSTGLTLTANGPVPAVPHRGGRRPDDRRLRADRRAGPRSSRGRDRFPDRAPGCGLGRPAVAGTPPPGRWLCPPGDCLVPLPISPAVPMWRARASSMGPSRETLTADAARGSSPRAAP